jgi:hypothetical protein
MDHTLRAGTLLPEFQSPFTPKAATEPRGRSLPHSMEPGFYEPGKVWMYGNVKLCFSRLAFVEAALGSPPFNNSLLLDIEREAERLVLQGCCLVSGIHNVAHQRAALVPLKWGAPRILVFSGGIRHHLGIDLTEEPFRTARLWRYEWDPNTDLAISRRKPESLPTYSHHNPTIDRMVREMAEGTLEGFNSPLLAFGRR